MTNESLCYATYRRELRGAQKKYLTLKSNIYPNNLEIIPSADNPATAVKGKLIIKLMITPSIIHPPPALHKATGIHHTIKNMTMPMARTTKGSMLLPLKYVYNTRT